MTIYEKYDRTESPNTANEADTCQFLEEILQKLLQRVTELNLEEAQLLLSQALQVNTAIATALLHYSLLLKKLAERALLMNPDNVHTWVSPNDFGNLSRYRVMVQLGAPPEIIDGLAYRQGTAERIRKCTLEVLYGLEGAPLQQILDHTESQTKDDS